MNYLPVSPQNCAGKFWRRYDDYGFAAKDVFAAISAIELSKACHRLPIAFIKVEERFELVVIQGLVQGKNLLVSTDYRWIGRYLPEIYRVYPFKTGKLQNDSSDSLILCFDEESGLLADESSVQEENENIVRFFNENGQPSETLKKVMEFMSQRNSEMKITAHICQTLSEMDLLEPWNYRSDGSETGFYKINSTVFTQLSADKLLLLRDTGALTAIYGQLFSSRHLKGIAALSQQREDSEVAEELLLDERPELDFLNFDNL